MLDLFEDWEFPHGNRFVLLGSCFSDNLTPYLEKANYHICSNPFGTLFHPIPIFNWIDLALSEEVNEDNLQLVFHENLWKSLCGGKQLRDESKEELLSRIYSKLREFRVSLIKADVLVITLGTAHAWIHRDLGIVGNCQRLPQQEFKQELVALNKMVSSAEACIARIKELNSELKIVFTVSPVKHWRMGVIENSRTKSRCIELAHILCESIGARYFPAYEYVSDILRNDEFFESDRCHPNRRAIELIACSFLENEKGSKKL